MQKNCTRSYFIIIIIILKWHEVVFLAKSTLRNKILEICKNYWFVWSYFSNSIIFLFFLRLNGTVVSDRCRKLLRVRNGRFRRERRMNKMFLSEKGSLIYNRKDTLSSFEISKDTNSLIPIYPFLNCLFYLFFLSNSQNVNF